MNEFVYKLTLDLNCTKTPPVICSGQFDKGRKFEFTITANGEPYDVMGCSAVLKGIRTDGSHFAVGCTVSGNKITKILDDTTLSVRGKTVAKLVISDSTKSYSTQMFIIDVDSALDGDITIADDYSVLNRLVEQIHALNESGAILVDDTIDEESDNAVANKAVATALAAREDTSNKISDKTKVADEDANYPSIAFLLGYYYDYSEIDELLLGKVDKSTNTVLFNADKIPIKTSTATTLGAGFATSNKNVVTAFISKSVTKIDGGTFTGCTNLTDVFIDNTSDNITLQQGAIPDTTIVHYMDNINFVDYLTNALVATNIALSGKLDNVAGAVTTDKLADDVKSLINGKYDRSNIEEGTADLTPYPASEIAIKSAKCLYTKIGKRIICNIKITMSEFSMRYNSSIHLIDLPFVTSLPDKLFFAAVTNKQDYLRASLLVSSSWVSILNNTGNTINFAEDDTIDCTVLYNTK